MRCSMSSKLMAIPLALIAAVRTVGTLARFDAPAQLDTVIGIEGQAEHAVQHVVETHGDTTCPYRGRPDSWHARSLRRPSAARYSDRDRRTGGTCGAACRRNSWRYHLPLSRPSGQLARSLASTPQRSSIQ